MTVPDGIAALTQLGFTDLESRVYSFLVGENPATGYRIAQAIAKPAANTYKAIESLERKGAVVVIDEEGTRKVRPVSIEEVLERIGRDFQLHRERAAKALKEVGKPVEDDRVYPVRSLEHAVGKARQMLAEAEKTVLIAASANLARELKNDLMEAAKRKVDVVLKASEFSEEEGIEAVVGVGLPTWSGDELRVCADGREALIAVFSPNGTIIQGLWTKSPVISLVLHDGLAAETCLGAIAIRIREDASQKRLLRTLSSLREATDTLGHERIAGA